MQDEADEIEKLRLDIMRMDHAYWVENHPIASDDDYCLFRVEGGPLRSTKHFS